MNYSYEMNPKAIERESFRQIRECTDLSRFSRDESQVAMRIVHSLGLPEAAEFVRISAGACEAGRAALNQGNAILCDVEMVKQGVTKRMITHPPICYLNDPRTADIAKQNNETRSMAALSLWQQDLEGSVVLIGNAPTALFRLLEMIDAGSPKPALVIGMPVGFVGAAESKEALWEMHTRLGIECMTLLGRMGGSAVTSASCNALLRCNINEYY